MSLAKNKKGIIIFYHIKLLWVWWVIKSLRKHFNYLIIISSASTNNYNTILL